MGHSGMVAARLSSDLMRSLKDLPSTSTLSNASETTKLFRGRRRCSIRTIRPVTMEPAGARTAENFDRKIGSVKLAEMISPAAAVAVSMGVDSASPKACFGNARSVIVSGGDGRAAESLQLENVVTCAVSVASRRMSWERLTDGSKSPMVLSP